MNILLPAEILGTDFSLIAKEDGTYEKYDPSKKLEGKTINIKSRGFWERMKLYGIEIEQFPPSKFRKPYESLLPIGTKIPWIKCIPAGLYHKALKEYIESIKMAFETDFSYYETYFSDAELIFNDLAPAAIDLDRFNRYMNEEGIGTASKAILRSFTPIHHNSEQGLHFTDYVVYSRTNSKTGRLTVTKGPQILHLKTDYRNILTSRYKNGGIFYLDFKSLEPRVLLARKYPNETLPKDIYKHTLESLGLEGVIDRDHVKTALISTINGAGDREVARQLDGKIDYPEDFIRAIKEHFGIEELREHLVQEYTKNEGTRIYNEYGRPILCEGTAPYILLNYYVQSTAVDVALLGFSKIWSKLLEANATQYCQPLFILHDALILDVHPEIMHLLEKIARAGSKIPKFENTFFWIDVERLDQK